MSYENWSVLSADFLVVLHLTIGGVTLSALLHLASAKWRYQVRGIAGSLFTALFPVALVLLVVLLAGALLGQGPFPWMRHDAHLGEEHPLNAWHNKGFFVAREILGLLIVGWLYGRYLRLQAVSERTEADWERFKMTANFIPVAHVLYGTMVAWDFEMTLIPSWHSSVYGMYHFVSGFGLLLSTMAVLCYLLSRHGKLSEPLPEKIMNYFAQMMLAFTILWTYLFFAQYLTIWYGNIPHERDRIENMVEGDYSVLWWTFFTLKFLTPFLFLIFTYFRHSPVSIFRIGLLVIAGTWIERFVWIGASMPSTSFSQSPSPFFNAIDWATTGVVLALAVWRIRSTLAGNGITRAAVGGAQPQAAG
jgi:hypothetical protein